jgi:surface polysaccharide O-acyltransferase-like enzyme
MDISTSKSIIIDNKKRYVYLDIIKIISAFMVVFYHMSRKMDLGTFENSSYSISFPQILMCFCSASIPLFFMVNGALILNKNYPVEKIYYKAAKIALLVFVWSFTGFPSWFLKTLIILYLLYPIFIRIYNSKISALKYLLMLAVFVFPFLYNLIIICLMRFYPGFELNILGYTISLATIPLRIGAFSMYSILQFFLGGLLFKNKIPDIISVILCITGFLIVIWGVIVYSNFTNTVADAVNDCFPTIGTLMLSVGLFNLIKNIEKTKLSKNAAKIISFFGNGVLAIYIFHSFFITNTFKYILTGKEYSPIIIGLFAVLILICCCIVNSIISRIPYVKELMKI